jgi:hypothetical protein
MLAGAGAGYAQSVDRELQRFREIYKELVETMEKDLDSDRAQDVLADLAREVKKP